MKKFRILLLITLFTGLSGLLLASPTSKEDALKKARQFYSENVQNGLRSSMDFQLVYSDTGKVVNNSSGSEFVCFYIFNAGDKDGFVIVSGDDAIKPILAYSDEGSFPTGKIPENISNWLNYYSKEIQYVVANPSSQTSPNTTNETVSGLRTTNSAATPLLGRIRWDQGDPYNLLCPYSMKYSQITVTGCVATAMAQVMKYYEWPIQGTGSSGYTFDLDSVSTTLTANFGQTTYKWNEMLDNYNATSTLAQDSAVALLVYHCGVAVDMDYNTSGGGGSSASLSDAGIALKNNFGYDSDLQLFRREFFNLTSWTEKLMNEIDAGRPVLYAGGSDHGGHAFVCDGYDSDSLFHFSWGWGGSANGYFSISILDPEYSGIGSSSGGYSQDQYAIAGIQKPDGVNSPSYQLGMYNFGMTSSKSSLSNISSDKFNASIGFLNWGLNSFSGYVATGLYKNGIFQKYLSRVSFSNINTYSGYNYTFNNLSLSGLAAGNYQLYLVHQPSGGSTWFQVCGSSSLNNYLDITISGSSATITAPSIKPELVLTSEIQTNGIIYQNKTGRFDISVKNNGAEFYSYLSIYIYSVTNPSVNQYLNKGLTVIRNGETLSMQLIGSISLSPGTYNAIAVYDSTNNFSTDKFQEVDQSSFTPLQFTIYSEPDNPVMTLLKKISITGGDTLYIDKTLSLNAEIKNTGGFYDNQILAFIFPSTGVSSLGYLNPLTIFIDTDETKTYTLTGSFDLDPGNYVIVLYYYLDGWRSFTTSNYYYISVTLHENPVSIENTTTESMHLSSNPVEESIEIITSEKVLQADIYDLNGRMLGKFNNSVTLPAGNLNKGLYILRVTTDRGITNVCFIK